MTAESLLNADAAADHMSSTLEAHSGRAIVQPVGARF